MLARPDIRPRHKNAGRPAEKSAPGFLQWLRGRPCYLANHRFHVCDGKVRACHVDHAGGKGMATKVADKWCIPMCDRAHDEQHSIGWRSFEAKYGFVGPLIAAIYWQEWPSRFAWERKQEGGQ